MSAGLLSFAAAAVAVATLSLAPGALCDAPGLDPTARAEVVPVAGFVALANAFDAMKGRGRAGRAGEHSGPIA